MSASGIATARENPEPIVLEKPGRLVIEVRDDEIIVTLPGTSYAVTYYKPQSSPQLLAKRIPDKDDLRTWMSLSEFLIEAWRAANDKARELGWIV